MIGQCSVHQGLGASVCTAPPPAPSLETLSCPLSSPQHSWPCLVFPSAPTPCDHCQPPLQAEAWVCTLHGVLTQGRAMAMVYLVSSQAYHLPQPRYRHVLGRGLKILGGYLSIMGWGGRPVRCGDTWLCFPRLCLSQSVSC